MQQKKDFAKRILAGVLGISLATAVSGFGAIPSQAASSAIYVSPSGSSQNSGTQSSPLDLYTAIQKVDTGGTIYMLGGTYRYSQQVTVARGNDGKAGQLKTIQPYQNSTVVLDFSQQSYVDPSKGSNPRGLQLEGSYWHVKDIQMKGSADNGIYVAGNNNTIEGCETYQNRDTGLQIGRYASNVQKPEWPANNLILNCTSHDNSDPDNGEDADGFACKLTTGDGNVFDGCISYNNVDDGWDLYTKSATGAIGPVTIRNCVAYRNGVTSDGSSTADSDGNGFKLGGDKIAVNHIVQNCVSFANKKHGFTYNSNPGSIKISNCTSFDNGQKSGSNFAFDKGTHVFTNNLSYKASSNDKTSGTDVNGSNVWWKNKKSTNEKGLVCSDADFVSLNPTVSRNADGSIQLGNFLKLASNSDLKGIGYGQ